MFSCIHGTSFSFGISEKAWTKGRWASSWHSGTASPLVPFSVDILLSPQVSFSLNAALQNVCTHMLNLNSMRHGFNSFFFEICNSTTLSRGTGGCGTFGVKELHLSSLIRWSWTAIVFTCQSPWQLHTGYIHIYIYWNEIKIGFPIENMIILLQLFLRRLTLVASPRFQEARAPSQGENSGTAMPTQKPSAQQTKDTGLEIWLDGKLVHLVSNIWEIKHDFFLKKYICHRCQYFTAVKRANWLPGISSLGSVSCFSTANPTPHTKNCEEKMAGSLVLSCQAVRFRLLGFKIQLFHIAANIPNKKQHKQRVCVCVCKKYIYIYAQCPVPKKLKHHFQNNSNMYLTAKTTLLYVGHYHI